MLVPDVTDSLREAMAKVNDAWWSQLSSSSREEIRRKTAGVNSASLGSWDIIELSDVDNANGWIVQDSVPSRSEFQLRFVRVDGETFHSTAVNYVIFGRLMRLLGESKLRMASMIIAAKSLRPLNSANGEPSMSPNNLPYFSFGKHLSDALYWASAGYEGWPDVETPASVIRSKGTSVVESKIFTINVGGKKLEAWK